MRRLVLAVLMAVGLLVPTAAHATTEEPEEDIRYTSYNDIVCPPNQSDEDEPPEGNLSYSALTLNAIHQYTTGEGVRIGLLDSGVNPDHLSLSDADIDEGTDITDSEGGVHEDSFGSGTTYASILVGRMDGQYPIRPIAPDATLVPIKVIDRVPERLTPDYLSDTAGNLADGIDWAIDNDVDLVITTLALPMGTTALEEAVQRADEAGLLIIAPVGDLSNDDEVPESYQDAYRYPAAYETVLAVTAVTASGQQVSNMLASDRVDIAAPGMNVPAASNSSNNAMCVAAKSSATSLYASVNAAGIAALLMSSHPDEDAATITHRIEATALRPNFDRLSTATGWGIINATAALHFLDDGTAHGPVSPQYGPPEEVEVEGRPPLVPDPDPQRTTKPITYIGLAAGGAVSLAILLGAAGLRGRKDSSEDLDSRKPLA